MRTKMRTSRGPIPRWLGLGAMAIVGLTLVARCGGGDDDDDEPQEETIGILPAYDFQLGGPLAGDAGPSFIRASVQGEFVLGTEPDIRGSMTCNQETESCELKSVAAGSRVLVDDETDPEVFTDFEVVMEADWTFEPAGSDFPVAGRFRIDPLPAELPSLTVRVGDCGAEGPGAIVTSTAGEVCYPWDDFDELMETAESDAARLAALGWNVFGFMVEQMTYPLEALGLIDEDDEILALGDPVLYPCDTYAATWPEGPPNPGEFFFRWIDDNPNGEVGPGDSFRQEYADCWVDEDDDDIDTLLNGVIEYVGYTEVVEQDLITRIGFENPPAETEKIGGVAYGEADGSNPLVLTETDENEGVITPEEATTVTGRYILVFFEP